MCSAVSELLRLTLQCNLSALVSVEAGLSLFISLILTESSSELDKLVSVHQYEFLYTEALKCLNHIISIIMFNAVMVYTACTESLFI